MTLRDHTDQPGHHPLRECGTLGKSGFQMGAAAQIPLNSFFLWRYNATVIHPDGSERIALVNAEHEACDALLTSLRPGFRLKPTPIIR